MKRDLVDNHEDEYYDLKSSHSCTDPLCCLLFVGALLGFGNLYGSLIVTGNVGKLYHGIDWGGRVCGLDTGVEEKPYLYWCASASASGGGLHFNTQKPVCVASCPDGSLTSMFFNMNAECALVSGSLSQMLSYKTQTLGHYCIPDTSEDQGGTSQQIASQLNDMGTFAQQALGSLPAAWPLMVGAFACSLVLGYLYLVMLRHCAEALIYLSIGLCTLGSLALGAYLWLNAGTLLQGMDRGSRQEASGLTGHEELATKVAAIVCFGLAALLVFMVQCLSHSIHVASACVEVACEVLFEMPSLLLAPIVKVFVKGLAFLVLLFGFLLLYSTCEMTSGEDGMLRHFSPDDNQKLTLLFYLIMAIWILAFISAVYQFMVAYSVVEYYHTPFDHGGDKDVGCCEVLEGLQVALMYHPGSLAFGSLLIALLSVLQKIIEYAERQNQVAGGNRIVACLLCIAACLVSCCKDMLQRVSRCAYIDMAITSNNFCDASQQALGTIAAMAASLGILTGATFVFSVFGVISICLCCGAFTYHAASTGAFADASSESFIESPVAVTVAALAISALVAFAFMDIVDMASDSLLYCYQMDRQRGTGGKKAPRALQDLFAS